MFDLIEALYYCEKISSWDCLTRNCKYQSICRRDKNCEFLPFTVWYSDGEI